MTTRYTLGTMLTYLRRPYFPAGKDRVGEAQLKHLIQLLFFSLALMIIVSGIVGSLISNALGGIPENVNQTLGEANPMQMLLMGVIFAPILEEVIFRSWLGGRRTCILGLPILASLFAVAASVIAGASPGVSFGLSVGLAVFVLALARRFNSLSAGAQKDARWRLFPVALYGSTALFAMAHLTNYAGGLSSPIMVLAILPQALVGLVLAYVRMRFGLLQAIVFHALYNLVFISIFFMSQSIAPEMDAKAFVAHPLALTLVVGDTPT